MIEAEVAFLDKIADLLELMEKLIKYVTIKVLLNHEEELLNYRKLLSLPDVNFSKIIEEPYAVMTFDEACNILEGNKTPVSEGRRFSKENELFLVEHNNGVPVFIVDWPHETKPFYVKADSTKVLNFIKFYTH